VLAIAAFIIGIGHYNTDYAATRHAAGVLRPATIGGVL
jgi:hypothetical protein